MKWLNFVARQKDMIRRFRMNKEDEMEESKVKIRFFDFHSTFNFKLVSQLSDQALLDGAIVENLDFSYPVFIPKKRKNQTSAIILLHGLNEKNWDKYLSWAEYLALHTSKPVILFPIAYHMNRSPVLWSDPRFMSILVDKRKIEMQNSKSLCFANVALSERLSEDPSRFYTSGRQTVEDLHQLALTLHEGNHPLFEKGTKTDFFAYSIGSFLAEITLMINPDKLFDKSRLFVFCGGSVFNQMFGESKFIMDNIAFEKLMDYFLNSWSKIISTDKWWHDATSKAFKMMRHSDEDKYDRERFFKEMGKRIKGISLKQDTVMPFEGVKACMGFKNAKKRFSVLDFPFPYSHEVPFPTNQQIPPKLVNHSFVEVFSKAALFLG